MRELSKRIFAGSKTLQIMPYLTPKLYDLCLVCKHRACIEVCPEDVIVLNADGVASLMFDKSGCVFCQECVRVCYEENGEHNGFDYKREEVNVKMKIQPLKCLAWNGSICSSCKDTCPCEIRFIGMFYPEIAQCNGCGLCISRCPMDAIGFKSLEV